MADWFMRDAQPNFERFVLSLGQNMPLSFLQLGAFQGDGGVWIMETFPFATLVDVDDFSGADDLSKICDFSQIERDYHSNMDRYIESGRTSVYVGSTYTYLRQCTTLFDCIYVDADHSGPATLTNAVLSWDLLKSGGFMGFDDYRWVHPQIASPPGGMPGPSIDAFCSVFADQLEVLPKHHRPDAGTEQLWVRKR